MSNTTEVPIASSQVEALLRMFPDVRVTTSMGPGILVESVWRTRASLDPHQRVKWEQYLQQGAHEARDALCRFRT